jgi:hypothetical protein
MLGKNWLVVLVDCINFALAAAGVGAPAGEGKKCQVIRTGRLIIGTPLRRNKHGIRDEGLFKNFNGGTATRRILLG